MIPIVISKVYLNCTILIIMRIVIFRYKTQVIFNYFVYTKVILFRYIDIEFHKLGFCNYIRVQAPSRASISLSEMELEARPYISV